MLAFRRRLLLEGKALTLAAALNEPGLAFDARDMSASVKGHTTNFDGDANSLFTYSSPSTKYIRVASGLYLPGTTMRCEFDAVGAALGLSIEEQRTTLAKRSRRLDDGTDWTRSNVTASTVTGVDGVSGSATRLTATANNATALGATNTSASAARRLAPFVRRVAGTGNIEWTLDGGSTWTAFAGLTSSWQRLGVGATVTNPQVGFRIVSNGDSVDVDFANGETGSNATSPIESTASQVTRAADNITLAVSAFPYAQATWTVDAWVNDAAAGGDRIIWSMDTGIETRRANPFRSAAGLATAYLNGATGGSGSAVLDNQNVGAGAFKQAIAYAVDDAAGVTNGGTPATDNSLTLGAFTTLRLGQSYAAATLLNGHLKTLRFVPRRRPNAELQSITA